MKRFWLKITGLVFFVLAAIIGIFILWPTKSPDMEQISQQDASTSAVQPNTENPQPKRQLEPQDFQQSATSRLQDQNPRHWVSGKLLPASNYYVATPNGTS
jgi:hypothetical protein